MFAGRLSVLQISYWQNFIMSIMKTNIDEQIVQSFRARLVKLRKEKGLSQVGLAKELGVDCSTIAKYETGDRLPDQARIICWGALRFRSHDKTQLRCHDDGGFFIKTSTTTYCGAREIRRKSAENI